MNLSTLRDRPHWSFSSLNSLLSICGLAWRFSHIDKLPQPFKPVSLAMGSVFHRVLEFVSLNRMEGMLPADKECRELFHARWDQELKDGPPLEKIEEAPEKLGVQGADLVSAYLAQIDFEERVLDVSRVFAVPIGQSSKPIVGELDCVVESRGETIIVDWKTSSRRWPKTQADTSLQPCIYLFAQEQLHPGTNAGFRYDIAIKTKVPAIECISTTRTADDFQRLERLVATADCIVEHELYWPRQSWACAGCQYAEPCKAWHRQAARKTVPLAA